MKLTNKLRTGVLATTLTGLIGCAEFEETFKESGLDEIIWQAGAAKARKEGRYEDAQALENIGFIRGNIAAARAGRSEVNVNVNTNRDRRTQQLPDNVILSSNGNYSPAQGYEWINPKNNNDLRVRRINSQTQTRENIGYSSEEGMMLTYGEWVDSDENGRWNIKELTDVKTGEPQERNSSKPFYFLVYSGPTGGFSTLKIVNTDTKEIIFDETLTYGKAHWGPNGPTLYEPGNYKGIWFRNGKLKSELEVKVVAE